MPLPERGPSELWTAGAGDKGLDARLSEFRKSSPGGGLLPDWHRPADREKQNLFTGTHLFRQAVQLVNFFTPFLKIKKNPLSVMITFNKFCPLELIFIT